MDNDSRPTQEFLNAAFLIIIIIVGIWLTVKIG